MKHQPTLLSIIFISVFLCNQCGADESPKPYKSTAPLGRKLAEDPSPSVPKEADVKPLELSWTIGGQTVYGDLMPAQSNTLVFMVHNEHSNRAEYAPIKHMLWTLKLNLLSIDLRSGGHKWGTKNHTVLHHKDISRPFSIVTEDIKTGLRWAKAYGFQNIFLLGQDTSASLILWLARSEPSLISGILIFSPSEYWIQEPVYHLAGQVRLPLFAASPYAEKLTMNARLNSAVGPHVMKVLNEPGGHGIDLLHQPVVLTKLSAFIKPFIKYVHKQQTPP